MERTLSPNPPDAVTIEAGSMSEVAQQKQRSQSAISRLMASLERVLGLALFEPTRGGSNRPRIGER